MAETTPSTVAVYRCLFALPFLGAVAYLDKRSRGRALSAREIRLAWIAGIFFTIDLIFWHNAIHAVGAGLATVLGNLQVVIVGFAAWAILGEKPSGTLFGAIPIVLIGVVLISGVVGQDAYGEDPALGVLLGAATSIAYAAFILILRHSSRELTRVAGPLFHATLASTLVSILYGVSTGDMVRDPGPSSLGWLLVLALTSQVVGWLLISTSLPRVPAAMTSVVLLLQPVGAMVLAAIVLREDPAPAQLVGAGLILSGVVIATSSHRRSPPPP